MDISAGHVCIAVMFLSDAAPGNRRMFQAGLASPPLHFWESVQLHKEHH